MKYLAILVIAVLPLSGVADVLYSHNSTIKGGFGLELGSVFSSAEPGRSSYVFLKPPSSSSEYAYFDRYYVLTRIKDNVVHSLIGVKHVRGEGECERRQSAMMRALSRKYGEESPQTQKMRSEGKRFIKLGNRVAQTSCSKTNKGLDFILKFYDESLVLSSFNGPKKKSIANFFH